MSAVLDAVGAAAFHERLNAVHEFGHAAALLTLHDDIEFIAIGARKDELYCTTTRARMTKGVALAGLAAVQGRLGAFACADNRQALLALPADGLYSEIAGVIPRYPSCASDLAMFRDAPSHPKDAEAVHAAWALGIALATEQADEFLSDCYLALRVAPGHLGIRFDRSFVARFFAGEKEVPMLSLEEAN
jgi:hypothetical protein